MNNCLITPELKDKVLIDLLTPGSMKVSCNIHQTAKDLDIHSDLVEAIIDQFERMGLIRTTKCLGGNMLVNINAEAHDLYTHGGFTVQEELLKANIEKLGFELESLSKQLSPDLLEKANQIAGIGTAILSALPLLKSYKEFF